MSEMKTFTIDTDNNIAVFATQGEAAAASTTPFDTFASDQELAQLAASWPDERLVAIWNSLPGVKPAKTDKVKDRTKAIGRIWSRVERLGEAPQADPNPEASAAPSGSSAPQPQAAAAPSKPAGASSKPKASKKATPPKKAPKGKKTAKAEGASAPREGSKTAQVVAMLQRKNGATLAEIMEKMDWQKHTVRGFMAGAMKKAGYQVESFKPEGGERTYRINK